MTQATKNETQEELLASADAGRLAVPPLTPAAVRAAAAKGYLRTAARTPAGQRLFKREDVLSWLSARIQRHRSAA